MQVRRVDPRGFTRSVPSPSYLVVLWEQQGSNPAGYVADEYELSEVDDVRSVLEWAERESATNRTFTVDAIVDETLVRLFGEDPTRVD